MITHAWTNNQRTECLLHRSNDNGGTYTNAKQTSCMPVRVFVFVKSSKDLTK